MFGIVEDFLVITHVTVVIVVVVVIVDVFDFEVVVVDFAFSEVIVDGGSDLFVFIRAGVFSVFVFDFFDGEDVSKVVIRFFFE